MTQAHHQHVRKRIHHKKEEYPHPIKWKRNLDRFIVFLGVTNVFATLPQVLEIWIGKDASGVSIISWSYWSFYSAMMFVYGVAHKEAPIIISYSIATIMYLLILIGAVIY